MAQHDTMKLPMTDPNGEISFENVNKTFFFQHQRTLKEFVHALFQKEKTLEKVAALRDVSFRIKKGEAVGVVGKNGAGKSTLLKLIARVSMPSQGQVNVLGKVAPLIELGAGFHPELTGRENIYLNGVILGLTEKQVKEKFDSIVDFADTRDFIDIPVKHYSSGMYMRLAFSVAVATDPQILLIDEIFAVGDQEFQRKCIKKMESFKKNGTTIVLVSHDPQLVGSFCQRVLYLDQGQLSFDGKVAEGLKLYADTDKL